MRFKDLLNEGMVDNVTKVLGKPTDIGADKAAMWKFKDGSYIKVSDSLSRIGYMDKNAEVITMFTTAAQVKKMVDQSGLVLEGVEIIRESVEATFGEIKSMYKELESVDSKWGDELDRALKAMHSELESLGYTKENDYTPDFEASDEEWAKYDTVATELEKKYKIGEINSKYSTIQDKIGNDIWNKLKSSIDKVPALKPYADTLTDEKHKFRIVNKFKDIIKKYRK